MYHPYLLFYVMKMPNHVIAVMQVQVAEVEPQRQPSQTPDPKHGQKRQTKQHRRVEPNRPAP